MYFIMDLNKMQKKIDEVFANETPESLEAFIKKHRKELSIKKLSFGEWLMQEEPGFHKSPEEAVKWFAKLVSSEKEHHGDCVGNAITCCLCAAEELLREYREYRFSLSHYYK